MEDLEESNSERHKNFKLTFEILKREGYTGMLDQIDNKFLIQIGVAPSRCTFPWHENMTFKSTFMEELIMSEQESKDESIKTLILSREGALVLYIAHELRHAWQILTLDTFPDDPDFHWYI